MSLQSNPVREKRLQQAAQQFSYPPTPDVAEAVMRRLANGSRPRARAERSRSIQVRSAWVTASLLVLLLAVLFAVPSVRAEIVRFLQVGVVRIFPGNPTQTAIPNPSPQIPMTATPVAQPTDTPNARQNEPLYETTLSGLAGETSLDTAQASLPFPIRLPQYPSNLGAPERVFLQEEGQMVILVWIDPSNPERARLSLHEIASGSIMIRKYQPVIIQETQVDGHYAVWAVGPYLVQLENGSYDFRRTVEGSTLIWEEEGVTYRLEMDLSLEEAVKIAESLK